MNLRLYNAEFVRSAADNEGFPRDDLPRMVFIGRSNVGKSSTINALVGRKNFARVSSMPGKTVFVNLFLVDKKLWFVDLPGYGYSKAGKDERDRYSALIDSYFAEEMGKISRLYLIVDARHKPTEDDKLMMTWIREYELPFTIIANKTDKLKKSELEVNLLRIREALLLEEGARLVPFSAEKGTNKDLIVSDITNAAKGCG